MAGSSADIIWGAVNIGTAATANLEDNVGIPRRSMTSSFAKAGQSKDTSPVPARRGTDDRPSDVRLGQYYTRPDVAERMYAIFREYFDPADFRMIEPSGGTGSFYKLLPAGSLGYDVEPKCPGIEEADFLTVPIQSERKIAIIGNPPFGRNCSLAIRFVNRAARQASNISLILPRTFRKASVENRIDRNFHRLREEVVPKDAFSFRGKPYNVPAVFQIWEKRPELRELRLIETEHPDFDFTTRDRADFAIQRVGAQAGRVHRNFSMSPSSHYFIKGDVEAVMAQLDFAKVAGDVAGNPSLSKSEIVSLYREFIQLRAGAGIS